MFARERPPGPSTLIPTPSAPLPLGCPHASLSGGRHHADRKVHTSPHQSTPLIPLPPAAGHRRVAFPAVLATPQCRALVPQSDPSTGTGPERRPSSATPRAMSAIKARGGTLFKMTPLHLSRSEPYCSRRGLLRLNSTVTPSRTFRNASPHQFPRHRYAHPRRGLP